MTLLALVRHGVTLWNAERRIQGRRDIALSPEGRAALLLRSPPAEFAGWAWVASPKLRCRETLAILHGGSYATDPRLVEMSWGAWEGKRLEDLRRDGLTADRESLGLDFRPPGGESPRDVQARVRGFLADAAAGGEPTVAVVHKGVIRAILALATDWDMRGKPPAKLDWTRIHLFRLDPSGAPAIERLNVPMESRS